MQIEIRHSRIHELLDSEQVLAQVLTGFDFTEGPVWNPTEKSLIFSDILGNSLYHWTNAAGLRKLRRNSYMANGNTYDRQGRLVTCEHATSRVTRTDFTQQGELEVLATHYQGRQLNSPNDIVCSRTGILYFTDPTSGRSAGYGVPRSQELDFQGVYRLDPETGQLDVVAADFSKPNGLCFSLDETRLFVDDTDHGHIRMFDLAPNGMLTNGQLWAELTKDGTGVADGMKIDQAGNLYCTGPGGIHIFDDRANYLGVVQMPEQSANLAWGDDDLCSLYITATTSIYRLRTRLPGQAQLSITKI